MEVLEFACGIPQLLKFRNCSRAATPDQVSTGIDVFSFHELLGVVTGITPFSSAIRQVG
jgi:hypothetical protein